MKGSVAGLSGPLALVLLLPMEAGVPIPLPADLVAGALVFWRVRRRKRATAPAAWMEAACPACIGVSLLAGRVPALAGLAAPDPVRPEPGGEPKVLVS